jgi:hypothetical protein
MVTACSLSAKVRIVLVGAGLVGLFGGCGGPQEGSQVKEAPGVAERRQKGIRDAMKSGAYGAAAQKVMEKK